MDSRWIQGKIEEYSFLTLAKELLPKTEFDVFSYANIEYFLKPGTETYRKKFVPRFHYVTKQEEKEIFDGTWCLEKNYENEEMCYGFYFPDVALGQLERLFPQWFRDEYIHRLIEPYYTETSGKIILSKRILTTSVFAILHEYGHYLDYKKFDSKDKFAMWIYDAKSPVRMIEAEIKQFSEKGCSVQEKKKLYLSEYRKCEDEKSADKYALDNLENKVAEALEIIYR